MDYLELVEGAHLSLLSTTGEVLPVTVGYLSGDGSGFLHIMTDSYLDIQASQDPFPASFSVYEDGILKTPRCNHFDPF